MIRDLENQISLILSSNCLKLKDKNLDRRIYPKSVHFEHGCFWLVAIENPLGRRFNGQL
jgi:hypothetical protein